MKETTIVILAVLFLLFITGCVIYKDMSLNKQCKRFGSDYHLNKGAYDAGYCSNEAGDIKGL